MARRAKYTEARILDAAGRIVAREGPNAATIGAIGNLLSTAGLQAALSMIQIARADLDSSRILLLYCREDFLSSAWPRDLE